MNRFAIVAIVVALVVGAALGFFIGRWMLERAWRQPVLELEQGEHDKLAQADADPVPSAGTKILKPMPLERTRRALKEITKDDPIVMNVAAVGNGEDGSELHVEIKNNASCTVTSFSGVAYGFDSYGVPAKVNKSGEHFVAFSEDKVEIEPGKNHLHAAKLRYPDTAALAVAHVDAYKCKDGASWARKK
jgi:hypothetical protein